MINFSVYLLNSCFGNICEYFIWFSSSLGVGCCNISDICVFLFYFLGYDFTS